MSISETTFHDIFNVVEQAIAAHPETSSLDPIADLNSKPSVRIPYMRKIKNNAGSAFMVFEKKDKNWIGLLLVELSHLATGAPADARIMKSAAKAKSTMKRSAQTWLEFVDELHHDKIIHRDDISEAQARQLVKLIGLLSANGHKLKGCGDLEFYDAETGMVL